MERVYRFFFVLLFFHFICLAQGASVSYQFSGGRFGDNLLAYLHAKWISFVYDIPLVYRPFKYSDQLELHRSELKYTQARREKKLSLEDMTISSNDSVHHIVPYFGEYAEDQERNPHWIKFKVDWDNSEFRAIMRKMIFPINKSLLEFNLPVDCFTVALHMRRGGGFDGGNCFDVDPLKFPPITFFIEQLKEVSRLIGDRKMYVFIFTDDRQPDLLAAKLKSYLMEYDNIDFDWRKVGNQHDANVLEDFFAMTNFECIIHSSSNYSNIAALLGNPSIEIYPVEYQKKDYKVIISKVKVICRGDK